MRSQRNRRRSHIGEKGNDQGIRKVYRGEKAHAYWKRGERPGDKKNQCQTPNSTRASKAGSQRMKLSAAYLAVASTSGIHAVSAFVGVPGTAALRQSATSGALEGRRGRCRVAPRMLIGATEPEGVELPDDCELTELEQNAMTAGVLSAALPYIQEYTDRTIVIKYGGHAMEDEAASLSFARDVVMLKQCGVNPVVVHGGGPQIAAMLKRLDMPTSFVEGYRVSDPETVEIAEMVLCGSINKGIASSIKQAGGRAVGLSGKDDNLLLAKKLGKKAVDEATGEVKHVDIGFVGDIVSVNTRIIRDLVEAGIVPIIAPIGVDKEGRTYNCNADTAAGAIAGALKAHRLLLLTDVAGVLNKDMELLRQIDSIQVKELMEDGTISGGMIPKVNTALDAVKAGVGGSIILDGRVRNALLLELFTRGGAGTFICLPE
eukprot:jgi/Undpi1/8128/HiC_scaffold_24.g10599.m1